jgi:NADH dehydrogenase
MTELAIMPTLASTPSKIYRLAISRPQVSEGESTPATRDILKNKNVSVELAEVTGFDLEARHVTAVQPGGRLVNLSYDSLIAAEGARQSYFGHDEYAEWAPGMKTLADALDHRARYSARSTWPSWRTTRRSVGRGSRLPSLSAGPTGVEIAGQIAELSRRSLKHNLRRFDSGEVRVLRFDGGPEILATFGDKLSSKATLELEKIGVEIHLEPDCSRPATRRCS